jgi:hypothetical protein
MTDIAQTQFSLTTEEQETFGAVLVSGENRYHHNRIATRTTTGRPLGRA